MSNDDPVEGSSGIPSPPPGSPMTPPPSSAFPPPPGAPGTSAEVPLFAVPTAPGPWNPPPSGADRVAAGDVATQWQLSAPTQTPAMAYRPGAIPLRPLTLGDMYDGAFRIVRRNLGATVGGAVLVSALTSLIPLIVSIFVALTYGGAPSLSDQLADPENPVLPTERQMTGQTVTFAAQMIGAVFQGLGLLLVTGMVAHVVYGATLGHTWTLRQAWAETRGRRWRLIGQALFLTAIVLLILAVPVGAGFGAYAATSPHNAGAGFATFFVLAVLMIPVLLFVWIRVYLLAVPPMMLEGLGAFGGVGRGYRLTSGQFWRTFGIALLTVVLAQFGAGLLQMPLTFATVAVAFGVGGGAGAVATAAINGIGSVLVTAFVAPFTAAVMCLQYLDLRIRKEALDVQLIAAAQSGQSARA